MKSFRLQRKFNQIYKGCFCLTIAKWTICLVSKILKQIEMKIKVLKKLFFQNLIEQWAALLLVKI